MNENPESAPDSAPASAPEPELEPDWKDRYLRLAAEFENFKKRRVREGDETRQRAQEGVLLGILPGLDHLEMAVARVPAGTEPAWAEGLRLILASFHDTLARLGYASVVPAVGDAYDPLAHEAIDRVPVESAPAAGAVLVVHAKGWKNGARLLRPARVTVSVPPRNEG